MNQFFFRVPFAFSGDKTNVPVATDPSGYVSYTQGYGPDYQRDLASDPLAKAVERDKMNYMMNNITVALNQYQTFGIPEFVSTTDNNGTPYSYSAGAVVRYDTTGAGVWIVATSMVDANTALPTDVTKWQQWVPNGVLSVTASAQTLTVAQSGQVVAVTTSGACTLTLADSTKVPQGTLLLVKWAAATNITFAAAVGAVQDPSGTALGNVGVGEESALFRVNGANWQLCGGSLYQGYSRRARQGSWRNAAVVASGTIALTTANLGSLLVTTDNGASTITLPAVSATLPGERVGVLFEGTGTGTVAAAGSDVVRRLNGTAGTVSLGSWSPAIFAMTNGEWLLAEGVAALPYTTLWASVNGFTTGDIKVTEKTVADTGFIMRNIEGSIGNASSNATIRANADTAALFALLWTNYGSNLIIQDSSGTPVAKGANAAADFAANRRLMMYGPGRALGVAGSGSLTTRALADRVGEETHTLTVAEVPPLSVTINTGSSGGSAGGYVGPGNNVAGPQNFTTTGGGGAHNNMQPTQFMNIMQKL